jgi:two-component system, OmpR family, sensor kinase
MRPRWPGRALIRTRVLAGVLLVMLAALAGFDVAAVSAARTYLTDQTDSQLHDVLSLYNLVGFIERQSPVAPSYRPALRPPVQRQAKPGQSYPPNGGLETPRIVAGAILQPFSVDLVSGKTIQALSPVISLGNGVWVGGNQGLTARLPGNLAALAASGQAATVASVNGSQPLRLLAAPYDVQRGGRPEAIIVAVTSLDGVDKTIGRLELILIIGAAAAGLVAAAGVAWVMRRGLRPIETMAGQADAITAGDLTGRVSPQDPRTEVGRLATALNDMLGRIGDFIAEREASQEATRRFFADASHELRTPLASLRANAELYQQGALASRGEVDEAMRRITLESQRMSGLVDDMLRLARLDQHPARENEPVDVTGLVRGCAERARLTDPAREWRTSIAPGLEAAGDEELLRRAIDNLVANVRGHTPAGTVATITAAARDGNVVVEVSDDGPGVPASELPRIFDRFYRGAAPSHRSGAGLGLAIVSTVAGAHHGTAEAELNEPAGLRVTLTVPARQPAAPGPSGDPASHHAASV